MRRCRSPQFSVVLQLSFAVVSFLNFPVPRFILGLELPKGASRRHASLELRSDKEIVKAACEQSWRAIFDACGEAKADPYIAAVVLSREAEAWCWQK